MSVLPEKQTPTSGTRLCATLLAVLVLCHLAQIASPLRLNTDSNRLLSMAISAHDGHGFLIHGIPDPLPRGYPIAVGAMMSIGLGSAKWLNAFSLLSALGAAALFYRIVRVEGGFPWRASLLLVVWTLSSWVFVKHAALPLTESLFSLVSFVALAALQTAWRRSGWPLWSWLGLGLVLSIAACSVRTVGIALFPAVALTGLFHPEIRPVWLRLLPRTARSRVLLVFACLVLAGIAFYFYQQTFAASAAQGHTYQTQQSLAAQKGLGPLVKQLLTYRLTEFGEILLNVPATRLGRFTLLAPVAGVVAAILFGFGLLSLIRRFPPVGFYACFYGLIILIWPYYDTRFWAPILPLLALAGWFGLLHLRVQRITGLYLLLFVGLGIAALAFSTRLTFAGTQFAALYGDGTLRPTYRAAFHLPPEGEVDLDTLAILQRLEPLAR